MKRSDEMLGPIRKASETAEKCLSCTPRPLLIPAALFTLTAAVLQIARQIAITREEAQNGKSSRFDQK